MTDHFAALYEQYVRTLDERDDLQARLDDALADNHPVGQTARQRRDDAPPILPTRAPRDPCRARFLPGAAAVRVSCGVGFRLGFGRAGCVVDGVRREGRALSEPNITTRGDMALREFSRFVARVEIARAIGRPVSQEAIDAAKESIAQLSPHKEKNQSPDVSSGCC